MTLRRLAPAMAVLLAGLAGSASAQLHRSFYGMAYSPDGVILPNCTALQSDVTADMAGLAQLTPRIRLYGADCNQTALVLQGIQDAGNVDLSVWLGIYIDGNDTVYQRQMDAVVQAIQTYGADHVAGITVGNEYLLNSYGANGSPTDARGVAARTKLLGYLQQANASIKALNLNKPMPIGTADAGSAITRELCAGADYIMANVHAWFGGVPVNQAADWVHTFFDQFDVQVCAQAPNNPAVYIAETGWPSQSMDAASATLGGAVAGVPQLQTFLDTFVCQANANGTQYFYFEYKDETWKTIYGGVEPYWGLYDADRTLKAITIPNCEVESPTGRAVNSTLPPSGASSAASAPTAAVTSSNSGSGATTNGVKSSTAVRTDVVGIFSAVAAFAVGLAVLC